MKFLKKRNRFLHHTKQYEITNLIVRRGQEFCITMKFNKPFDESKDKFKLLFETGWLKCTSLFFVFFYFKLLSERLVGIPNLMKG